MRTCPKCSLVNPDSAIVCDCGQVVDADAAISLPADALRPPPEPARRLPPAGLATKIFAGFCGYIFGNLLVALVWAVLAPSVVFPSSLTVPAGIAGAVIAVKSLAWEEAASAGRRPQRRRRNYLVQHWRGELSLAVSYWVNGWLATFVVLCASAVVQRLARRCDSPYAPIFGAVAISIVATVGEVWCVVGTWRSANRPTPDGRISSWSWPAKVALLIGSTISVAIFVSQGWPALRAELARAHAAPADVTPTPSRRAWTDPR